MYIVDGIAYAGDPAPMIKVSGVRPMKDHKLWVRFSTGTAKLWTLDLCLNAGICPIGR